MVAVRDEGGIDALRAMPANGRPVRAGPSLNCDDVAAYAEIDRPVSARPHTRRVGLK